MRPIHTISDQIRVAARRCGLLLVTLAGCGGSADAPSVRVASGELEWSLGEPTLTIGRTDSLAGHPLHQVRDARRAAAGQILVADGGSNEVRVFDSAGHLLTRFGGPGEGPAEFGSLQGLWLTGSDSVLTWDARWQRLSSWSAAGGFGRTTGIDLDGPAVFLGPFQDRSSLVLRSPNHVRMSAGLTRTDSAVVFRVTDRAQAADELITVEWQLVHAVAHPGLGGRTVYTPTPFDPRGLIVAGPDYFYYAWGDKWEIYKYSPAGAALDTLKRSGDNLRVTSEMLERRLEDWLATVPPELQAATRSFHNTLPYPQTAPVLDHLLLDDLEHLWVRHFVVPGDLAARWSIFGPEGNWLGEMELPVGLRPTHIGEDFLLAVVRGENNVEEVSVFPLRRGAGTE